MQGRTEERVERGFEYYLTVELFDLALLCGMSAEEYWYGDPDDLANYIHAYNRKRMQEAEQAWLIGQYVLCALQCSPVPVGIILDKKDVSAMPPYPHNPACQTFEQTPKLTAEEIKQRNADIERIKMMKAMCRQKTAKLQGGE